MKQAFEFKIKKELPGTLARAGIISTPHGKIKTPAFIVGATKATVKALTPDQLIVINCQAVLANVYHLMLRPGTKVIKEAGGLAEFMSWPGPTVTDSGGFQIFSLGTAYKKGVTKITSSKNKQTIKSDLTNQLVTITDEGVTFRSHIDGLEIFMSPENSMRLQHQIAADIHMAFDECLSPLLERSYISESLDRTNKWAVRSLECHNKLNQQHQKNNQPNQALFGIIQGARYEDLRRAGAKFISNLDFDGYGIGGVYEPEEIQNTVRWVSEELPKNKPRHLLGMGSQPADLFLGIEYGIDMFDCVAPTRQARNGGIYTRDGHINIKNAKFVHDFNPIDKTCDCYTCQNFSKAYLSHLFKSDEMLGATLASIHNEKFVVGTVDAIRSSILDDSFFKFKKSFLSRYYGKDYHLL